MNNIESIQESIVVLNTDWNELETYTCDMEHAFINDILHLLSLLENIEVE